MWTGDPEANRLLETDPLALLIGLVLTTLLVGTARFAMRRLFYSLRARGVFVQRALIVGTNDDARAILGERFRRRAATVIKPWRTRHR